MAKALKYEKAIINFLNEYSQIKPYGFKNVNNQVIIDKKNQHYQLIRVGWHERKHVHYAVFHFDIIDDKIWIQQNRTDRPVVNELVELGIPEKDIVVACFTPVEMPEQAAA
ncbi:MAG: XisI protein [Saprospiraceae bacterium]